MAGPILWAVLAATTGFHGAAISPRAALPARRVAGSQVQSSKMIDQNMVVGGAVALLGSLGGVALVAFTESAGERTNARGALSDAQAQKFAGKFLEDVEADQSGTIDDVVAKMEAALNEKPVEVEVKPEVKQPSSDGW